MNAFKALPAGSLNMLLEDPDWSAQGYTSLSDGTGKIVGDGHIQGE
jgi:uncharacterized surface protein with fasciclin (FAS1) repeats